MRGLAYNPGILPAEMIIRQRVKPMPSREELLKRKSELLSAITVALKEVNEVEAQKSNLDAEALIKYLHYGKK